MHLPPINKLDPEQQAFLEKISTFVDNSKFKNQWIKGFAGSGKSVLLAYSAKIILTKKPNAKIIVIVFTWSLVEMFKIDLKRMGLSSQVSVDTYYSFMNSNEYYDFILCDEVQDLTSSVLKTMLQRSNHVIVAGDSNQSIYERDPKWNKPTMTPSDIDSILNGETYKLGIIHRLSRSIIRAVHEFLPDMNIFNGQRDMTKSDTQIRICNATSESEEVNYVFQQALKAVNHGYSSAILIPTRKKILDFSNQVLRGAEKPEWVENQNQWGKTDFRALNSHLDENGIKLEYIGNGAGLFNENNRKVYIMTYHSAKGLDFDNVFMPYVNTSMYISPNDSKSKTLFMVAMTRSRENLYITYSGAPNTYLDAFKGNCSNISISSTTLSTSESTNIWGF